MQGRGWALGTQGLEQQDERQQRQERQRQPAEIIEERKQLSLLLDLLIHVRLGVP